jgi:hypothetical protein
MACYADTVYQNIKNKICHLDNNIAVNMAKLAVVLGEYTQVSQDPSTIDLYSYKWLLQALEG